MLKIKFVGPPGATSAVPVMCRKCKRPIRQKNTQATEAHGICKKCLLKNG